MPDFPQIPGYTIKEVIGTGGAAIVYLAIQEIVNRTVAIKVLKPECAEDSQYARCFLREARIASNLNHPNIITIYDVKQSGKQYYIIMEYLEESLRDRLDKHFSLSRDEAIKIVKPLLRALKYAHEEKIIHRDIKPENILFKKDGTTVIADFGLARALDSNSNITRNSIIMGTPNYMSPEQCKGKNVDHTGDIYSLGVVLYEMFTGEVPYTAQATSAILDKHVNDPVPTLPDHLKKYQPLIGGMMAKDKKKRFLDANQVLIIIGNLGDEASILRKTSPTLPAPAPSPMKTDRKKKKRTNVFLYGLWAAAVIIFIAMIALLLAYLSDGQPTSNRQKIIEKTTNNMARKQGGNISFTPESGTYNNRIEIQLTYNNLTYVNSKTNEYYDLPSDVYYTINGPEPTRENGLQYHHHGEKIFLTKPGTHIIKAKVFSKLGKYEGEVYTREYTIQPMLTTIKNFTHLDREIRYDIYVKTRRIQFEVEGIKQVRKVARINMEISISQYGKAKMESVFGFTVEPTGKLEEVQASMAQKIGDIAFLPPTRHGKPVSVKIWIDYKKIAKFGKKILLIK